MGPTVQIQKRLATYFLVRALCIAICWTTERVSASNVTDNVWIGASAETLPYQPDGSESGFQQAVENRTGDEMYPNGSTRATGAGDNSRVVFKAISSFVHGYCQPVLLSLSAFGCVTTIIALQRKSLLSSASVYICGIAWTDLMILFNGAVIDVNLNQEIAASITWRSVYSYYVAYIFPSFFISYAANVWTIIAFAVERLIAICYPLKSHIISSESRAKKIVWCIFTVVLLLNGPRFFSTRVKAEIDPETNQTVHVYYFTELGADPVYVRVRNLAFSIAATIIPVPLLAFLNLLIVVKLHRVRRQQDRLQEGNTESNQMNRQIERILVAHLTTFTICHILAATVVTTLAIHGTSMYRTFVLEYEIRYLLSTSLAAINPFLNFLLYVICSDTLRSRVKDLFRIRKFCPNQQADTSTKFSSS